MKYLAREVGGTEFMLTHWRRKPEIFRRALLTDILARYNETIFWDWCRPPATARVFVRSEERTLGSADAWVIPSADRAPGIYRDLSDEGVNATILLNGIDRVDQSIRELRAEFDVGLDWRYDDVVATLSMAGSGIGYHAGHEDGFIVQLRGRRNWKVWAPDRLSVRYRRSLLNDSRARRTPTPPRPTEQPLLECDLDTGDVLYIPALHGHEGITLESSTSLSVGWKGITHMRLLGEIGQLDRIDASLLRRNSRYLFEFVPDPPVGQDPVDWITREVRAAGNRVGANVERVMIANWITQRRRGMIAPGTIAPP